MESKANNIHIRVIYDRYSISPSQINTLSEEFYSSDINQSSNPEGDIILEFTFLSQGDCNGFQQALKCFKDPKEFGGCL